MAKTVIITGGSRGIGAACARKYAENGFNVVIVGRDSKKLDNVKTDCEKLGAAGVLTISFDLSQTDKLGEIIDQAVCEFGGIDILINNAGTMKPGGLEDQKNQDFDFVMAINCKAPVFLCQAALKYLKASKGSIINISSTSSFTPFQGILSYNMSKAALDHFTKTMATNLMTEGVRVNSINPATVRTDIHYQKGYNDEQVEDYYRQVTEKQPLGGVIEPEQIAEAAWMMTSPALPSLTGQLFIVDGGRSQHPV